MEIAAEYDLLVAGAGPAGSSAAITAARAGARVILLEQGHFPRHKVCGEFISAECLELLDDLLGSEAAILTRAPRVSRARFYLGRVKAEFAIPPCASIPRYELDFALWEAARRAGVTCLAGVRVDDIQPGFRARTSAGEVHAASAIVASGRWSKLRQPVATDGTKWLGIKAHFREADAPLSTDLYFSEHGYCGVQPLSPDRLNVCAMVKADRAASFEEVFELHPELSRRSRGWTPSMQAIVTSPLIFAEPQPERDGILFAGDAAGFIDPFAGDGISLALRTGAAAAECALNPGIRAYGERYRRQFLPAFRNAARARRLLTSPDPIPEIAMRMMNVPLVARLWFSGTRGKAAA